MPKKALATAIAVALVVLSSTVPPAAGAEKSTVTSDSLAFTLVTGDKVFARRTSSGVVPIDVRPGPGRDRMAFHKLALGKQQLVVPLDAMPLVNSGVVDSRLFDVALLGELGLEDKSAPKLPLLVQYAASGTASAVRSALPEGTEVKRDLPIIDAVAIGQQRAQAGDLWWSWLNSPQAKRRTGLAGTVKKVLLDGGVTPNLDRSVPQIGAPTAWEAGLTGKGVKVAVLDSGYDATHPDLKDRVVATKGFTGDDVLDVIGHGTHVASTVAGTGAASDGKYRGVAPDADLLIGKVCGGRNCETSAIIAGMEWAANSGARVVNMSIGGGPSDGTDILSETLNKLTADTGTLFVVSAGNFGAASTVSEPAAADAALAVASVTKSDGHSAFSSQGPRFGDLAVKPDISAPGSRIVAARAANTPLDPFAINASYAELSGTSMAAPHVAGAAALLAQAHPDWKAPQLKSALMGASLGLRDQSIYTQGAGRVDVAAALKQPVLAMPSSLNLGLQAAPHSDDKPVTKPVTYFNNSAEPVRLSLKLNGAKLFKLSTASLLVPANGSATVDVTADTSGPEAEGAYGAWLVATGNGKAVRTNVGVGKEITSYEHKVQMLDRNGEPAVNDDKHVSGTYLIDVERLAMYSVSAGESEKLPPGRYIVDGYTATLNDNGVGFAEVTYFTEPNLVIGAAGPITLDGRQARKLAVRQPVTDATAAATGIGVARTIGDGTYVGGVGVDNAGTANFVPTMYVVPNRTVAPNKYTAYAHVAWVGMADGQDPGGDQYLDSPYFYHDSAVWPGQIPANPSVITDPRDYAHVDASYAGEPGYRANNYTFPALPQRDASGHWVPAFVFTPAAGMNLPFRRDEYYSTKNVLWSFSNEVYKYTPEGGYEYLTLVDSEPKAYPAGRTTQVDWQRGVFGPSLPDPRIGNPGRDALPWSARDGDSLGIYVPSFADGVPNRLGDATLASEHTTLIRNGQEIGASDSLGIQTFAVPPDEATYQLTKVTKRADSWTKLSPEISSRWTFRSKRTPDGVDTALPLLNVRYSPQLDERNRAPQGRFEFPVTVQTAFQAPVRPIVGLQLSASFDDGKTWQEVPVRRTGAAVWKASLDQTPGFVTLRAQALDAAGNRVDQTITRAYEVK
ncbi:S8 family serine peptidase [Kribbella sp. NPDC056345]|uniref:S8 family serine peptidase n=1 Tax=Kribbella sp. NPDC056345 TaxID=3345789 RepID=UPI0035D8157C